MSLLSIQTWWQALSGPEQIYWGIAIIASLLFFVQMIFSFVGIDSELDIDLDDADAGIGIFSVKGIISFFMFFGWGGDSFLRSWFSSS